LLTKGYEVYYPTLKIDPVNPRAKKERPYFPQYMFVNTDLKETQEQVLQRMPYVISLVKFGGIPATISQRAIKMLRSKIDQFNENHEPEKEFEKGDIVEIVEGPFSGYEGIFDKSFSGEQRVQILLTLLSDKKLRVELSKSDLNKKE
jgi:transcription antitermination factor NusG